MKLMTIYKRLFESDDDPVNDNPVTQPVAMGDWMMPVDVYNKILSAWSDYYGEDETAEFNFWDYQNDVMRLWDDGGDVYRIIFLTNINEFNPEELGDSWTVSGDALDTIGNGVWFGTDKKTKDTDPFIISAKTPPHNVTVRDVDIAGNPEECEINIIDQSKLTNVKIKPYTRNYWMDK